jgi:hypothetical protein
MHVHGMGRAADLAAKIQTAPALIGKSAPSGAAADGRVITGSLNTDQLANIVGQQGEHNGQVYKILRCPLATSPSLAMPSLFGDDRGGLRLARLEQFHHARETALDLLGLGGLTRILASTSPACSVSPSFTIRCACDGMW